MTLLTSPINAIVKEQTGCVQSSIIYSWSSLVAVGEIAWLSSLTPYPYSSLPTPSHFSLLCSYSFSSPPHLSFSSIPTPHSSSHPTFPYSVLTLPPPLPISLLFLFLLSLLLTPHHLPFFPTPFSLFLLPTSLLFLVFFLLSFSCLASPPVHPACLPYFPRNESSQIYLWGCPRPPNYATSRLRVSAIRIWRKDENFFRNPPPRPVLALPTPPA